jgi:YD repeat-containing protein
VATSYGYDSSYQLLSATPSSGTAETYTYDTVGNRCPRCTLPNLHIGRHRKLLVFGHLQSAVPGGWPTDWR